jgi:hypothetical protein
MLAFRHSTGWPKRHVAHNLDPMKKLFLFLLGLFRRFNLWKLKLQGKTTEDVHEERILTGKAWADYCDTIKAAGTAMLFPGTPKDAFNQAEGYRYLSRLVRGGLEAFIEYADPLFPRFQRMVHETVKLGADNPDNFYVSASISGQHRYRVWGKRGTAFYLGFATQLADYTKDEPQVSGSLEADDLKTGPEGSFEIVVSVDKPQGDVSWLPMSASSRIVLVRQTFLDRAAEKPAELHIERVGGTAVPGPLTAQMVDEGLNSAGLFVTGSALFFAKWSRDWKKHANSLPQHPPEISAAAGGDPNIAYYHSYWELGDDECLELTFTPPKCQYWNFQLNNYWIESLDYRYFPITLNQHSAEYRPDGSVRLLVAHKDPGLGNWIDTAYHRAGTMSLRWVRSTAFPPVHVRKLTSAEARQLPR